MQSLELRISMLTQSRDELTTQLVELTQSNEALLKQVKKSELDKLELQELDQKYSTLLEMLGEKEEKILELEHDIADMKDVFRAQIAEQFQ
jgi:TATA element modulatory factor